jgi:hypothetical protein
MRDNAIGWFFIDLGSWGVSAYDEQLLVFGATQ